MEIPHRIVCHCSDGEVLLGRQENDIQEQQFPGQSRTLHQVANEGEGLHYSLNSPLPHALMLGAIRMDRLRTVLTKMMPHIKKVTLVHHWPCGMANEVGLSYVEAREHLMRGRDRVEIELGLHDVRVVAHIKLQTGYNTEARRYDLLSVYVDPKKYLEDLRVNDPERHDGFLAHRRTCEDRRPEQEVERLVANG
jgi:hypothetical protein